VQRELSLKRPAATSNDIFSTSPLSRSRYYRGCLSRGCLSRKLFTHLAFPFTFEFAAANAFFITDPERPSAPL
jgi:hypothetical protein